LKTLWLNGLWLKTKNEIAYVIGRPNVFQKYVRISLRIWVMSLYILKFLRFLIYFKYPAWLCQTAASFMRKWIVKRSVRACAFNLTCNTWFAWYIEIIINLWISHNMPLKIYNEHVRLLVRTILFWFGSVRSKQIVRSVPVPLCGPIYCWIVPQRTTLKMVRSWVNDYIPDQQVNGPIPTVYQ
jgi:hypothetical protein